MGNVVRHQTDVVVFNSLSLWSLQINSAAMPTDLRYFHRSWVSEVGGENVTESDLKVIFFTFAINNHWCRVE